MLPHYHSVSTCVRSLVWTSGTRQELAELLMVDRCLGLGSTPASLGWKPSLEMDCGDLQEIPRSDTACAGTQARHHHSHAVHAASYCRVHGQVQETGNTHRPGPTPLAVEALVQAFPPTERTPNPKVGGVGQTWVRMTVLAGCREWPACCQKAWYCVCGAKAGACTQCSK